MSDIPSLRAAAAIYNVKKRLLGKKLKLETSNDFKAFRKVCKRLEGKNHTQWTDWQYTDLKDGFSYWLKLTDLSGKIVAVCVTRTIELTRGTTLLEYLKAHFERVHLDTPDEAPGIGHSNHEFLSGITGRFCYFGDLYINQGYRRDKTKDGRELAGDLAKLQLLMAYLDYDPDYIFCFVKMPLIVDGFAARCGFWNHIVKPLDFSRPPRYWKGDECFCWMDRGSLRHLFKIEAS